jgi:DNA processing protein
VRVARDLAFQLARRDITVLSGLARGIDTAAHTGALDARGRTIAVMGTGILHSIYPPENAPLADRIRDHGALVSQFWPDSPPRSMNFPLRNVVMSGMSIGTVVVEASSTSGAKMQARLALEHGKKVFLLKSLVMKQEWARKYSARPNAIVVDSAEQIVELVEQLARPPQQLSLA